jgi:hypothetical protein
MALYRFRSCFGGAGLSAAKANLIVTKSVAATLDKRQGIVLERTAAFESFIFHFFGYRCRFVERGFSDKRAGQRYPISQS